MPSTRMFMKHQTNSRLRMLKLEQRILFDGAAAVEAVEVVDTTQHQTSTETVLSEIASTDQGDSQSSFQLPSDEQQSPLLLVDSELVLNNIVVNAVTETVTRFITEAGVEDIFALFDGGKEAPDQAWLERLAYLRESIQNGSFKIDIVSMEQTSVYTAVSAFTAEGPNGQPTIFVHEGWLSMLDNLQIESILIEEFGHAIDQALNPENDTAGDEGELFAAQVLGDALTETERTAIYNERDYGQVTFGGVTYEVEFAAFNFVNAYQMVYDLDNDTLNKTQQTITTADIDTTERWADKEQNSHFFNVAGLGPVIIDDNNYNSAYFSGNDVSAIGINIGGTDYYGWVSRPIKSGGVVRGFYFWTDNNFTNLAAAQNDGNRDVDGSVLDNKGFLLVVDQAWFDLQIQTKTQYSIINTKDGNLGSVWVSNVGSSSDRVDSSLNSLIVPNSAPIAANDSLSVNEDSGTTLVSALNGLLRNDTDVNNDTLTVTAFSVGGVSTTIDPNSGGSYVISNVGSITINKDGSYSFSPIGNYNGPVPPITYSISDGNGGTATAVLSIMVTSLNDAPTASNDSVTTSANTPKVLTLDDFGTYADPENDPLTKIQITQLATNGTLQVWNGSTWTSVGLNDDITVAQILQGMLRFAPDANESGNNYATIQFKVFDGLSYSAAAYTLTAHVTPGNQAPVANADTNTVLEAGFGVAAAPATGNVISGAPADSDPENTTLAVTVIDAYGNTQSVNTSTTSTTGTAIVGQYGTLTIGSDGSYSYVLNNGLSAIDTMNIGASKTETFTYTITDGTNRASTTLTLTINGTNDAPVAADDFSSLKEGLLLNGNYGTVNGNALSNDSDVDSTLSIGGSYSTATGSAQGSSTYSFTVSSSINSNNYVFYDDDDNASTRAIVLADNTLATGEAVKLAVDYNGSTYDMLVDTTSTSGTTFKIVVGGNPISVALNDNKQGIVFGLNSGAVGFSANSDASGNYKVSQVTGQANPSSTTVIVSNVTTGAIAAGMTVTDGLITRSIQSVVKDSSGNVTSLVLDSAVTWSSASLAFSSTASPLVLSGQYGSISINRASGEYTYTLTSNALNDGQVFEERFSYRATDNACTDDAIITIRIAGASAPYLQNDTLVVSEDSGTHVTFNGIASGTDSVKNNDADGTTFTLNNVSSFKVAGDNNTYSAGNTATITGVGTLSIAIDGSITFDPVDNYLGPVPTVTYTRTGSDSQPYTANLTISIQAFDDASVLTADTQAINEDSSAAGNVLANDTDNDSTLSIASYTWNNGSGTVSGTVGNATPIILNSVTVGTLTLNANGSYTFVPTANWNGVVPSITYTTNTNSSSTLGITVNPVNDAPTLDLDDSGTGTGFSSSYTNASSVVSIGDTDLSIVDIDDTNIESAVIVLTNAQSGDLLNVGVLPSDISVASGPTLNNGALTLTLSGSATKAAYQTAIQAITFSSTGTSTLDRVISVNVNDGNADSNTAYTTIDVSSDNRAVTVMGTVVNEASPYVMFEVTGVENQWVSLEVGQTGSGTGDATLGIDFLPNLQYFNGTSWVNYTGGQVQIPDTSANNGQLLVRTAVLQDSAFETTAAGYETLKLTVRNAAGSSNAVTGSVDTLAEGMAQIRDDGQGSIYLGNNVSFSSNISGNIDLNGPDYPSYLDDDRPVSVDSIVVNEASPWAMFTVTGYNGQEIGLALHDGTAKVGDGSPADGTEDYSPSLQYWNGSAWTAYSGSVTMNGSTILVRTAIHQDTLFEGQHSFSLGVTKLSSGATVYGTADIYDDGTGGKYEFDNVNDSTASITSGPGAGFDDDRTLSINSPEVNEASNYVVFTLTGNSGQTVSLQLVDESVNGTVNGKANIAEAQTLRIWDGLDWGNYNINNLPTFDANGKIFVRVSIIDEQDSPYEGPETFKLNATLAGQASPVAGTATIKDNGTGTIFTGTITSGAPDTNSSGPFDNDTGRTLTVTGKDDVSEGSPAVFDVVLSSAYNTAQTITLSLGNLSTETEDYSTAMVVTYFDPGNNNAVVTVNVNSAGNFSLAANVTSFKVRVATTVDSGFEGAETFSLAASVTSGPSGSDTATILDDGSGKVYNNDGSINNAGTPDDDRPISEPVVVIPPPAPAPIAPPPVITITPLNLDIVQASPVTFASQSASFDPSAHVLAAVNDARAQTSGNGSDGYFNTSSSIGAGLGMDISLHVLPAVGNVASDTRAVANTIRNLTSNSLRIDSGNSLLGVGAINTGESDFGVRANVRNAPATPPANKEAEEKDDLLGAPSAPAGEAQNPDGTPTPISRKNFSDQLRQAAESRNARQAAQLLRQALATSRDTTGTRDINKASAKQPVV